MARNELATSTAPVQRKSDGNNLIDNKYRLLKQIGEGAFGKVYEGIDIETKRRVAIKIESSKNNSPLKSEYPIYRKLQRSRGICEIYYHGKMKSGHHILVMELLGKSLENLFVMCNKRFSIKTVTLLADQILSRLKYLHSNRFIHRDIKPDNFAMGRDKNTRYVYLIDFGLSKSYRDSNMKHILYRVDKKLAGTVRYASINAHSGIEQSRRDDLESFGYVMLYFLRGSLPWQGLKSANKAQKYEAIAELKSTIPIEELCRGFPNEFAQYLMICRSLNFEENPPYDVLIALFRNLAFRHNFKFDYKFDWTESTKEKREKKDSSKAVQEHSKKEAQKPNAAAPVAAAPKPQT